MSEWVNLEDIADLTVGYVGNMTKEYKENGVVFLRSLNIEPYEICMDDIQYISDVFNEKISKSKLYQGDIVIVRTGIPGTCCVIPEYLDGCNCSDLVIVRPDRERVNSSFLEAYINFMVQRQINNNQVGAIQKHFNVGSAKKIKLMLPDKEIQDRSIKIITDINEKIRVNKRISEEIDLICRIIYNYWFLQFDFPKEDGKPYKASGGEMAWNDEVKRDIPIGWKVKKIKDCVEHINTGLNPRDNFELGSGDIKYITVKNLTTKGTIDFADCDYVDESARAIIHNRSDVAEKDILFASIAPLGRCVIVQEEPKDWDINESVFCIRPNTEVVSTEFLYMFFMSDYFIKKAEHNSTGSVFNGIRISTLEEMLLVVPPKRIINLFVDCIKDLLMLKHEKSKENRQLESLRNLLLPKVMNGTI